ncbi:choice-of-anchor M domain-containing protein [Actinokineospora pegani]|uniref:choice-of-anchor M domain-containing protein n=1 Tax=Actinokineospora pegani TaxID=2654637 RepID=UPI0012EA99E9|nr:choice-of-anchor M domain-containing protein [Actinokineospora pegani]
MRRTLALAGAALAVLLAPATASAQQAEDQTIAPDQPVATDRAVLSRGHVDLGPRRVDGAWELLVHDDSATPPVWRPLERTVFQVSDAAVLPVPDDPAYAFIGAPGTPVHVLPQVQDPDVAWIGWNTQDPRVMDEVDRGVTLTLTGVDGPGELFVYLQAGNFAGADVLWDSTEPGRQDIWVDTNTHTHANWVFTAPGVYLVRVEVHADLVDGSAVSDHATLRFAVGDATGAEPAFAAVAEEPVPGTAPSSPAEAVAEDAGPGLFVIAGVAGALAVAVVIVVVRGRAAKRQGGAG